MLFGSCTCPPCRCTRSQSLSQCLRAAIVDCKQGCKHTQERGCGDRRGRAADHAGNATGTGTPATLAYLPAPLPFPAPPARLVAHNPCLPCAETTHATQLCRGDAVQ